MLTRCKIATSLVRLRLWFRLYLLCLLCVLLEMLAQFCMLRSFVCSFLRSLSLRISTDTRVAPGLQGAQRALQRSLNKSNLFHALRLRPDVGALEARGILPQDFDYGENCV